MSSNKSTSQRPRGRQPTTKKTVDSKPVPAPQQAPTINQGVPPKEPGMFQRVAETAAGVAVGSTIGNLVSSGISSLFGSSGSSATPSPEKPNEINPCEKQKLIFEHCVEKENELTKCEELQKEYKECRVKYNLP